MVMAQPYLKWRQSWGAGFIYEGDGQGGSMRSAYMYPEQSQATTPWKPPSNILWRSPPDMVLATNHFLLYQVDSEWEDDNYKNEGAGSNTCNGDPVAFSSLWRYKAGLGRSAAWWR